MTKELMKTKVSRNQHADILIDFHKQSLFSHGKKVCRLIGVSNWGGKDAKMKKRFPHSVTHSGQCENDCLCAQIPQNTQ